MTTLGNIWKTLGLENDPQRLSISRYMCGYLPGILADGCGNYLRMVVAMIYHYGTDTFPRQCIQPGMWVKHNGMAMKVSAVPEGKRLIHLQSLSLKTMSRELMLEVYLDGKGYPLIN